MDRELKRKLAAILVADVVGYSRLIADDEEATLRRLEVFRAIWQDVVTRCNGRIFNTAGDSILAEFQSAVEAVRCAVEFQSEARKQNDTLVAHRQMHFRIGITIGDVVERGTDLLGDGVNVAARLQTLAGPGGICVSSWVREAVANKLGVKFADLGDQTVKNIPAPIRAYKVVSASDVATAMAMAADRSQNRSGGFAPPMQDWLGRAVSSWKWLAVLAGILTTGGVGVFYVAGQLRSPSSATSSQPSSGSGSASLSDVLRNIDKPKGAPQTETKPAQVTTPQPIKTATDTPKQPTQGTPEPVKVEPARPGVGSQVTPQALPKTATQSAPLAPSASPQSSRPSDTPANPPVIAIPQDASIRRGPISEVAERALKPGDRFKECDNCPEMVVIPQGEFVMGSQSTDPGHEPDEMPTRKVVMGSRIAIARYPVTVDEFDTFVTVTGYRPAPGCRVFQSGGWIEQRQLSFRDPGFRQTGNHPVVCVNWNDAKAYTDWMSSRQRAEYRLPTEAEREYATRGGTRTLFWWGDRIDPTLAAYDWSVPFSGGSTGPAARGTFPVAAFHPNPFGLVQVHGNVSEWVEDCWNDSYRNAPLDGSAWSAGDCRRRVLRGGSWGYSPKDLRAAYREGATLDFRNFNFGFRVVRVMRDQK